MIEPYNKAKTLSNTKPKSISQGTSPNKISLTKKTLIEWSLASTIHCYPKIFQYENKLAKLMWFIIFIGFSGLTGYLVMKGFLDYLNYEVVSKIEVVIEAEVEFPTVTICSMSDFTTKQGENFMQFMWTKYVDRDITNMTSDEILMNINTVYTKAKYELSLPLYNDSFRQQLGFNLSSIQSCIINLRPCNLSSDFRLFYLFNKGNCIQFNSGINSDGLEVPVKTMTFQGENNGLILNIDPLINENRKFQLKQMTGLSIYIHNKSMMPGFFDSSIFVEMGKQTNIGIKRTFSSNLPRPYSDCDDLNRLDASVTSDLYKFTVMTNRQTYRQSDCFNLCIQKYFNDNCQCYFTGIARIDSVLPPCILNPHQDCFFKYNFELTANINEFKKRCADLCPLECHSVAYDMEVSSLINVSKYVFNLLMQNKTTFDYYSRLFNETPTYELYKESQLSLLIYYTTLQRTQITQAAKISFIDLISNLGGTIGIFLGMSIFSLIECVEICGQLLLIFLLNKKIN